MIWFNCDTVMGGAKVVVFNFLRRWVVDIAVFISVYIGTLIVIVVD